MAKLIDRDEYVKLVGQELGVSSWRVVDQPRIDAFAAVTEDHQFIHVDPVRAARETPFGGTIAHGFLTLSLLSTFAYEVLPSVQGVSMSVNYGFDKLRFISPVRAGSRVRGRFRLTEATWRTPGELMSRTQASIEIENVDRPALVADWLGLLYFN